MTTFSFGVLDCVPNSDKESADALYQRLSRSKMAEENTFIGSTKLFCYGFFSTGHADGKSGPVDPTIAAKVKALFDSL